MNVDWRDAKPRGFISAKYLLAEMPARDLVMPAHIKITQVKEGLARGLTRNKGGAILGTTSPRNAFTRF
jgi:hypothetical protein